MNLKAEAGDKIDTILDGNFDEFQEIYTQIANNNTGKYPKDFSQSQLSALNKSSSSKMALNQMLLNSPSKNVSFSP